MSVFLPNGKNFIRKCLHSKYVQVFFTAINSYSWISAPHSLVAIFNMCHCTGLHRCKKAVIVVEMCAAVRPGLSAARVL